MSFIAECTFCNGKVRVPDGAAGLSVPCPKCGNFFTLAASTSQTAAPVGGIKPRTRKKKEAPVASPPTPAVLTPKGHAATAEEYLKPALQAEQLESLLPGEPAAGDRTLARSRLFDPLGVLSFFLGSTALLLVQISALDFLPLPLSSAGLLLGLVGTALYLDAPRSKLVFPVGGAVVSAAVLVILCFWPALIGGDSRSAGEGMRQDVDLQTKVPLKGKRSGVRLAVQDDEWVDASSYSLQHGDTRVRVESVDVKPVQARNQARPAGTAHHLVIGLRLVNAMGRRKIFFEGWGSAAADGAHRPTLRDNRGHGYALAPADDAAQDRARRVELRPRSDIFPVLVFEASAEQVEFLRLALPASAFGGTGTLRLQVPASMITYP